MKLKALTEEFIAQQGNSDHYSNQLRSRVRKFCEFHGKDLKPKKVKAQAVNNWLSYLEGLELSPRTVRSYRGNLVTILNYAAEQSRA